MEKSIAKVPHMDTAVRAIRQTKTAAGAVLLAITIDRREIYVPFSERRRLRACIPRERERRYGRRRARAIAYTHRTRWRRLRHSPLSIPVGLPSILPAITRRPFPAVHTFGTPGRVRECRNRLANGARAKRAIITLIAVV